MRIVNRVAPWVSLIVALSCSSSPTGLDRAPTPSVASITVDPPSSTLIVGVELSLHVVVQDANGNLMPDAPVTWTVKDADIANVSSNGVVTARTVGTTQVAANSSGKSGIAVITVRQPPVARVSVRPVNAELVTGGHAQLAASTYDAGGATLTGRIVTWASSNQQVATVDAEGMVSGLTAGSATITATSEGQSDAATATVREPPVAAVAVTPDQLSLTVSKTSPLAITVRDAGGTVLAGRNVAWTSSNEAIASVSPQGLVSGVSAGAATITATSEGVSGTAAVTVSLAPVASVGVQPTTAAITAGTTATLTAVAKDAGGASLTGRATTWTSSNELVARVSPGGVVTGVAPGTATITAASEGKSGSAAVTVTPVPVGSIAVAPAATILATGQTAALTATLKDATGAPLTDRVVTWRSSNVLVATVSPAGVVAALTAGTATITATSEGRSADALVTVTPSPVGSVAVVPGTASITAGQSATLTATVKDANGVLVTDRLVTWTSTDARVASVSASGVVHANATGSATITALSEGEAGSATVTVTSVPVGRVEVAPTHADLTVGQHRVLTATVKDGAGAPLSDRPLTWTTSNPLVATVSATGDVAAVGAGGATITAKSEGRSAGATVAVTAVPVGSVAIAPLPASLVVGQAATLVAVVKDANGLTITDRGVAWSSSNSGAVTVSSSGVVTAVAPGTAVVTATSEGTSGGTTVTVVPVPVGSVEIAPTTVSITKGRQATLSAVVKDANGVPVTDRPVTWTPDDLAIALVSPAGVVTAVKPGTTTIAATSEGKSGRATVTVLPTAVGSVAVQPQSVTIASGQPATLTATVKDVDDVVVTDRVVSWNSSNTSVATVTPGGIVTGVAAGSATLTATSEAKSGSATVTVTATPVGRVEIVPPSASITAGKNATLTALLYDANGVAVSGRAVTWTSGDATVATVSSGVVTAVSPGTATITAMSEGTSGTASVTVTSVPVLSVEIAPASAEVWVGHAVTFTATVRDANNAVTARPVTWKSSNPAVATASAGIVTGVAPGTATITALSEGKSASVSVGVVRVPVASVTVAPPTASIAKGKTIALAATVTDADHAIVTDRGVAWTSSDPLVATVSAAGVVTGVAPGTVTITATSEGTVGRATLSITPAPVASVVLAPSTAALIVGDEATLTPTITDATGAVVTDRAVTWSSSAPLVASVSPNGVVTAVAPGTATISATSEGILATATITVAPVPVGSVAVQPTTVSLQNGTTTTLTATVRDTRGTVVTDRPLVWTSGDLTIAKVSSTGAVAAVGVGTATITATSEGKSGSAVVTVAPVPVGSVSVTPASADLRVGRTATLAATVSDGAGAPLTDRAVSWSSGNEAVATVSSTGIVTALAPGTATITATSEGKSGSATVTVTRASVGTVEVAPASTSLVVGEGATLVATVRDVDGVTVTDRSVLWNSSNTAAATVSDAGVVTAMSPGSATITATSEGKSGAATVDVTPVPVGSVTVTPATANLDEGETLTLDATVRDRNQVVMTDRAVAWASSDDALATVSPAGVVTAQRAGTVTITATSEGKSGSATIEIRAVVASVVVTPATARIGEDDTVQLKAVALDRQGQPIVGRAVVWKSGDMQKATVSPAGLVRGKRASTVVITATVDGKSDSCTVTVTSS